MVSDCSGGLLLGSLGGDGEDPYYFFLFSYKSEGRSESMVTFYITNSRRSSSPGCRLVVSTVASLGGGCFPFYQTVHCVEFFPFGKLFGNPVRV